MFTRPSPGSVLVHADGHWLLFAKPIQALRADRIDQVVEVLREAEHFVNAGRHAAGFVTYEAAPAFDRALRTQRPDQGPLAWFGIYDAPSIVTLPPPASAASEVANWNPDITPDNFVASVGQIKELIACGDTYQVNYTFRMKAEANVDAWQLFCRLARGRQGGYASYVHAGETVLCSFSPELFFSLEGDTVQCRPMKGTAHRGLTLADDQRNAAQLRSSEKNRAENIMIVDMIRNDLGRVAVPGTVETVRLFDVERYDTVWQMTSTVRAQTGATCAEIFRALFPCASVTGAPKVRTMQIISELETSPRGVYTGAIGYMSPGRRAQFSVAIRTVETRTDNGPAQYGTGSGIVWDSSPAGEWEECLAKTEVLREDVRPFQLLETLRWDPASGYHLLQRHIERVRDSAEYFGFAFNRRAISEYLDKKAMEFPAISQRVRLLLGEDGSITVTNEDTGSTKNRVRVALAKFPVRSQDRFLYHKTTRRGIYEKMKADFPGHDDVVLWNERGEITESTMANIVVQTNARLLTPPVLCGLLPGTQRAEMLASGEIEESILRREDLASADSIFLINSVRGKIPAILD